MSPLDRLDRREAVLLALVEAVEAARPVVQNGLKGMLVTVGEWEAAAAAIAKFDFGPRP